MAHHLRPTRQYKPFGRRKVNNNNKENINEYEFSLFIYLGINDVCELYVDKIYIYQRINLFYEK